MSDEGFDFKVPPRREAKSFEPPPWEQDAFQELQRRKTLEQPRQEQAVERTESVDPEALPQPGETDAEARTEMVAEERGVGGSGDSEPRDTLDDRQVIEMLAKLAEQEPKLHEKTWKPAMASAMVVGAIGTVMTVWGVAAMVRIRGAGLLGVAGGMVLLGFGGGFIALATWIAVRTLRQRGVL